VSAPERRQEVHTRHDGSTHVTTWTKTAWHCVACGLSEVWEDDCDDYYAGSDFRCASCGASFEHPEVGQSSDVPNVLAKATEPRA
jgi:transcription elongation factor Elf1